MGQWYVSQGARGGITIGEESTHSQEHAGGIPTRVLPVLSHFTTCASLAPEKEQWCAFNADGLILGRFAGSRFGVVQIRVHSYSRICLTGLAGGVASPIQQHDREPNSMGMRVPLSRPSLPAPTQRREIQAQFEWASPSCTQLQTTNHQKLTTSV